VFSSAANRACLVDGHAAQEGFAVANEVKEPAQETAKPTQDITTRVDHPGHGRGAARGGCDHTLDAGLFDRRARR
jgi:hypothetical protein